MNVEVLTKQTIACGQEFTLYSVDGWRWYSQKDDALRCQKQSELFWQQAKKSILKSGTFAHKERAIGKVRAKRKPAETKNEIQAQLKVDDA